MSALAVAAAILAAMAPHAAGRCEGNARTAVCDGRSHARVLEMRVACTDGQCRVETKETKR